MGTDRDEFFDDRATSNGTTCDQLAKVVFAELGSDILGLWTWLQANEHLPTDLPADWDPIFGKGGVYDHWGSHLLPTDSSEADQARLAASVPESDPMRMPDALPKPDCPTCTVMNVIWRCWLATRPRRLDYIRDFEKVIVQTSERLKKLTETYRWAAAEFAQTHADRMTEQQEDQLAQLAQAEQADGVDRSEMAKQITNTRATSLPRELQLDFANTVVARIRDVRIDLLLAHERAAVLSSNSLGQAWRVKGAGRRTRFETELWKMLRDSGFKYRQIGEDLVRPDDQPEDMARYVEDRLRKTESK